MPDLKANLTLRPEDAARFFAAKGEALSWDYTDVWREANAHAFTVAKATSLDVLRTIRAEVDKAIGVGQTLESFKKALRPRLEELGWWGQQEVLDADTGEVTKAQLGSTRRLRTIYQTNVQTSYMAGRYKRLVDNADDRPYWRYVAIMDGRTRPEHAALNGKVWRWDDPIWQVIWPPNGWGCRCRVVALTQAEFDKLGVALENGRDAIVELQVPIGRDGQTVTVQGVRFKDAAGRDKVFRPDPGWDYNPGAAWARFDDSADKAEQLDSVSQSSRLTPVARDAAVAPVDGLQTWSDLGRPDLASSLVQRAASASELPAAQSLEMARRIVSDALLPGGQAMREVATPVGAVMLRPELLPQMASAAELGLELFANLVVPTLEDPFEVWLTPYSDGSYRTRYLAVVPGQRDTVMLVRLNRDGSLHWEAFDAAQADGLNALRVGTLLFGKKVGRR